MAAPWKPTYAWISFIFLLWLFSDTESRMVKKGSYIGQFETEHASNIQSDIGVHWPKGIVTYYLDTTVYDSYIAQRVRMAMNTLESASCVRFKSILIKPTSSDSIHWIHITNPQKERKCAHALQYLDGGEMLLVIGFDCLKMHEILHTLLHAIGFKDEVSHPHRDQYIRILWNNIQPEYRQLYQIQYYDEPSAKVLVEYNPRSIMHFHDRAFSANGQATAIPLVPGLIISPSTVLSELDKLRLRLLFDHECNKRKVGDLMDTCKTILSNNTNPQ